MPFNAKQAMTNREKGQEPRSTQDTALGYQPKAAPCSKATGKP